MTQLTNAALDTVFEPRGGTTKLANVGIQTLGVDISNRYMQPSQGGTATAAATGIQSGGSDISNLFTQIGTVASGPNIIWNTYTAPTIEKTGLGTQTASVTLVSDGSTTNTGGVSVGTLGAWLDNITAGNGSSFECRKINVSGAGVVGSTTFVSLNTDKSFSVTASAVGTVTGVADIEVQEIGNAATKQTLRVTFTAIRTGGGGGGGGGL